MVSSFFKLQTPGGDRGVKRIILLLVIIAVAFSYSCSKKEKEKVGEVKKVSSESKEGAVKAEKPTVKNGKALDVIINSRKDPVSNNYIDLKKAKFSFVYKNVRYYFETEENYNKFKENPEAYIKR